MTSSFTSDISNAGLQSVAPSSSAPTKQAYNSASQILIGSNVQRLVNRLPYNSGLRLSIIEDEELLRRCVANLVGLSRFQLGGVLKELLSVLEGLCKSNASMAEEKLTIDLLQSQLFIVKVMLACVLHQWKSCSVETEKENSNGTAQRGDGAGTATTIQWLDPPALDDSLAKQLLSVMTSILRQATQREEASQLAAGHAENGSDTRGSRSENQTGSFASRVNPLDRMGSNRDGGSSAARGFAGKQREDSDGNADWQNDERGGGLITTSTMSLANDQNLFLLCPSFPASKTPFDLDQGEAHPGSGQPPRFTPEWWRVSMPGSRDESAFDNVNGLTLFLYRYCSQIIFYLSTSNWPVMLARFKNRLGYLSSTAEDNPSTADLRILECSNLQRGKLSAVIQEITGAFLHLKRNAQQTLALVLRRAIWAWIQYHPDEFAQLSASGRRLEGGADVLFDHVNNIAESTRKKVAFWPMMTALLILCPDCVTHAAISDSRKGGSSMGKKVAFVDALRKGLRNQKLLDASTLCCVDICKAATFTTKHDAGLRLLVPDLEVELKERLFDPNKPTLNASKQVDTPLMIELFVALFKVDPNRAIREVVPTCLAENSPLAFRIALVKACGLLASEQEYSPWNCNLSLLYPHISSVLRLLFRDLAQQLNKSGKALPKLAQEKRSLGRLPMPSRSVASDEQAGKADLVEAILQLWGVDLNAACEGLNLEMDMSRNTFYSGIAKNEFETTSSPDTLLAIVYALVFFGLTSHNLAISDMTESVLAKFYSYPDDGPQIKTVQAVREVLLYCSPRFMRMIMEQIISSDHSFMLRHWLHLLHRACKRVFTYVQHATSTGSYNPPDVNEIRSNMQLAEIVSLIVMCSADTDVCAVARQVCLQEHALRTIFLSRIAPAIINGQWHQEWTTFNKELAETYFSQSGRIAQQKRIRTLLRAIQVPSAASVMAWKEAYSRWKALTQVVARPLMDDLGDSAQEKAAQWHNYAGFLAAFGGACAVERIDELPEQISPAYINSKFINDSPPIPLMESFIQEMVDLLVSDSIWVREKVKETLGADLSPRLNGILFRQVHAVLSDFFDKSSGLPRPADMFTIFVEQSISVVQMVVKRMTEPNEATSTVDIGSLMVLYVEYVNSLGRREQAIRIKTAMCLLCEALMGKKEYFAFAHELRVRNRLFQALVSWISDPNEESISEKADRLQRELDVICLKTVSILLDKLPLLLADDALRLDDKVEWAKSRQFAFYFGVFIKILNRTGGTDDKLLDLKSALGRPKDSASKDLTPLKSSAIMALSNLLASNVESGLQHSLHLAYQDDPQIRTAFMQIMTNVLNQGTAFHDFERLTAAQKQSKLVELVSEPDMQLALSISQVCRGHDADSLDAILLSAFDSRGGIMRFLKSAVLEEILSTPSEEMVFRSNSFRTHLLSVFARTHGYEFLRSIIGPLVMEMAAKPRGYSFEIDPQRIEPGDSVHINQARLEEMAQAFIDQIRASAHRVPAVLRELCRHIRQVMDVRFPNSSYQGRGGFIFLRVISPAIVAPQTIDVQIPGAGRDIRRGLLLISKIIQTLVTHSLFPSHKEPFMTTLNDFLKRNIRNVTAFLDAISDARTDPERLLAADRPLGYGINPYGYGLHSEDEQELHRFLLNNVDKIGKELLGRGPHNLSFPEATPGDGKRVYDQLCAVLADMGEVKNEESTLALFAGSAEENRAAYYDFLRRSAGRPVAQDSYRTVFYEGPISKGGRPVFYYCAAKHNAETADFEGFILHILQTMEQCMSKRFELLLDFTGASQENLWPTQWLFYFASLSPSEMMRNLETVIVLNMNTPCKLYLRPLLALLKKTNGTRLFDFGSSRPNFFFCNAIPELESLIDRRNMALDPSTLAIMTAQAEIRFPHITMVWYYRSMTPVSFRIGGDHLQITAIKEQEVFPGQNAFLNDVFHLGDIDDVRAIAIRGDESTFFLSARGGTISFLFNSRDRAEVVQALRQAKAKVSQFRGTKPLERTLLPSDVPGTILNMAMLNITSDNYQLRLSAYDLLCALSTSFSFSSSNARKKLFSVKGLALPANMIVFISELSKDFATAAPGVTLEFLLSFFEGFQRASTSQKIVCLHYMAPWLSNLSTFAHATRDQHAEHQKRIKEILTHLINITTKQPDMYAVMQRVVWSQLSKLDDLNPLFLEIFSEAAMDSGIHTEQFEAILGTMVSFGSINLRGKLLARLRRANHTTLQVIAKTAHTAQAGSTASLHEHAAWKEIETLVRMNMMLSFTNRLEVMLYLPELLHIILLLAGCGVDATRAAIYGTAINLMHSICTEDPKESKKTVEHGNVEGLVKLREFLQKFAEEDVTKLFGLPQGEIDAFNSSMTFIRESPDNAAIEKLALLMYSITEMAAPSIDTANSWRARLTSLVTSTAFQYNPIIQSRAFVLLGCLAQGEIDDDLLYQILVSLRGSLTEWANHGNDAPIISIVACLSKVVSILPPRSRYLPQMFWLGVAVIQYGHVPLFKVGIDLLRTTIATIWERELHVELGEPDLIAFLLDARFDFRDAACRMDDESGVDFEINFSFGMAALLVRGLRHPSTKEATTDLLQMLLRYTAADHDGQPRSADGRISEAQLGFFVGLLPTAVQPEAFGNLLRMAGVNEAVSRKAVEVRQTDNSGLFNYLDAYDNKIALLVVTLAASLLQHAESDQEKILLYCFLADSARMVPAIVSILYDSLAPGMREVTINSQVAPILDAVNAIAQVAVSEPIFSAQAMETTIRGGPSAYLEESGYASLLECGSFTPLKDFKRLTLSRLMTTLLLGLIDAGTN
ncbi:Ras GTPase activating protein ira2 [Tilletia horrida]|nr:Ras GTPase activating protein ira2 [Tilletia horrida]